MTARATVYSIRAFYATKVLSEDCLGAWTPGVSTGRMAFVEFLESKGCPKFKPGGLDEIK